MTVLRVNAKCFRCNLPKPKLEMREFEGVGGDARYECFECFKRNKPRDWGVYEQDEDEGKQVLYCERCKYEFFSTKPICQYCSKDDRVILKPQTVRDLL